MTELEKITEFAKRKNVPFRIKHETDDVHKIEHTVFVFGNSSSSVFFPINISFPTIDYEYCLEEKKLAERVIWKLSSQLANIKAREEFDKDMEFLKTLKEK